MNSNVFFFNDTDMTGSAKINVFILWFKTNYFNFYLLIVSIIVE